MKPYLAVHHIYEEDSIHFDASEYSKFKFGRADIGYNFGATLAQTLINQRGSELNGRDVIVYPSPYFHVAPASENIAKALFDTLLREKSRVGISSLAYEKIVRQATYIEDYGSMDSESRYNLIKNDHYTFERSPSKDAYLLFVDDIHVTGSHQRMIEELIGREALTNPCIFLYYIAVEDKGIDPTIENRLNFAAINTLDDLPPLFKHPDFRFNTRIIKFILRKSSEEVLPLLRHMSNRQVELMLELARGNTYHEIQAYRQTYNAIENFHQNKTEKR